MPALRGDHLEILWDLQRFSYVLCHACLMQGPGIFGDENAAKAWNALPRHEDVERLNREADFLAEHLHRAGIPCPGDGEKFDPYGECAERGWPCVACFREWARQETQEGESK